MNEKGEKMDSGRVGSRLRIALVALGVAVIVFGGVALAQEMMFPDVSADNVHLTNIQWAAQNGIVEGYADGTFGPRDNILRQQAASMFARYDDYRFGQMTFEVTLENLTDGQPLSPPVFYTSNGTIDLFQVGAIASPALVALAEDGDNSMVEAAAVAGMATDVEALGSPVLPGESVSVTLTADAGDVLSFASMLVRTNDAFVGVDGADCSFDGDSMVIELMAWDAGSEANNQLETHVPGPPFMGTERDATEEPISAHPGLVAGTGDFGPDDYGWQEPAAMLTITKMD